MVMYCVAFGCKNGHVRGKEIPFHSFPFKRPKLLKLWIEAIRRKNWKPSKSSRICGAHFLSTDYLQKPGSTQKLLKPDAIPSVFSFTSHLLKKVTQPRRRIMKQEAPPSTSIKEEISIDLPPCSSQQIMDIDLLSISRQEMMDTDQGTSSQQNKNDSSTQTPSYFDRTYYLMNRKVKTLRQKIRRRDAKISAMKDAIRRIKSFNLQL
ncbi:THAP domain-containing protein 1 isoform X1 [Nilaparvata lugens]|uniref:THAP domain-containing protein 1 isoform X1 n=1 Tax=Nilaparvata lugens TaxID=108931 RepID=UPI00193D86D2|nr:THAP domain-containing protein 1 isoform X1 [Nilaparvata lugens]